MIPNAEKIIGAYLRTETGERVSAKTPSTTDDPWIRVTLIDDAATDGGIVNRSIANYFQIDCYAGRDGSQATARAIAAEVRDLLMDAVNRTFVGATVSGAESRMRHNPDLQFDPQMECYMVTATVWMHE